MYYVLMEKFYQFTDDNKYDRATNSGTPKKVFISKAQADEAALKNNLNEFQRIIKDSSIKEWGYSLDEILYSKVLEDEILFEDGIFMIVFGQTADDWWESVNKLKWGQRLALKIEPSPEQWKKLYDCFNLRFWEVLAVEPA